MNISTQRPQTKVIHGCATTQKSGFPRDGSDGGGLGIHVCVYVVVVGMILGMCDGEEAQSRRTTKSFNDELSRE